MAPESGGRAPTIDTASGWALAKAFTLWRTVGPGGAAAGSSKAPMARVLRAREKSGRRRNMAASRSALEGGQEGKAAGRLVQVFGRQVNLRFLRRVPG